MENTVQFATRADFRAWLQENCQTVQGVWLLFGKKGGPVTLAAEEALEEALCFGWIDSQMKSIDEKTYVKYFSQRRKTTEWSKKNIGLVEKLEAAGLMTEHGRRRVEEAIREDRFKPKVRPVVTPELIDAFIQRVKGHEPAYTNLLAMSPSVKKTYTGYSLDVKSEEASQKRLEKIIDRLNRNLPPM